LQSRFLVAHTFFR
jgi:ATP-dependent helicase STH1/SNF2